VVAHKPTHTSDTAPGSAGDVVDMLEDDSQEDRPVTPTRYAPPSSKGNGKVDEAEDVSMLLQRATTNQLGI
jgi:hypothetical protein